MKEISEYILRRLDFNENKIRECLKDITDIRKEIQTSVMPTSKIPEIISLLSDEKYRIMVALSFTNTKKEAYGLLNMNERTFYRKLKEYKL